MKKENKKSYGLGLPVLIVGVVAGGIIWSQRTKAEEGDIPNGVLLMEIIPSVNGIGGVAGDLLEGSTGNIARVGVGNASTRAGQMVPYTFLVAVEIAVNDITIYDDVKSVSFAANEQKTVDFTFSIPINSYGTGRGYATLLNTAGDIQLEFEESDPFTVIQEVVIPNGTITWDVVQDSIPVDIPTTTELGYKEQLASIWPYIDTYNESIWVFRGGEWLADSDIGSFVSGELVRFNSLGAGTFYSPSGSHYFTIGWNQFNW